MPKRAGEQPLTRLTAQVMSDAQVGLKADVGRRFGPDKALGVRFNGSLLTGDTAIDGMRNTRLLGAVGLDHRTDRTRVSLDIFANRDKVRGGAGTFAAYRGLTRLPEPPDQTSNYFRGAWQDMKNQGFVLSGELDINPNLTAYAAIGARNYEYDGYYSSRITLAGSGGIPTGAYTSSPYPTSGTDKAVSAEAGLRGQFYTGSVKHVWGLGANSIRTKNDMRQWYGLSSAGTLDNPVAINPDVQAESYGYLTKLRLTSVALTDSISFQQDRVRVLLGLRHQQVSTDADNAVYNDNVFAGSTSTSYSKSALTPMLGVIARPIPGRNLSVYANYIQGLSQGGSVTDTEAENYGQVFPPYKTKQYEVGVKFDSGGWTNTLAAYEIRKPSLVEETTASGGVRYTDGGNMRVRGVEWTTAGEPIDGLRVLGGVAYGNAKYVRDASLEGKTALATPKWRVNLGADWAIPGLPGLAVNVRMVHTSAQWGDSANTLRVPSWTRWDAGLRYATVVAGKKVTWRFTVENLANKAYWDYSFRSNLVTLSQPRTAMLSMSVDL